MTLMDLSGKLVRLEDNITSEEFILKREGLNNGMYLFELRGEKIFRGKIILE